MPTRAHFHVLVEVRPLFGTLQMEILIPRLSTCGLEFLQLFVVLNCTPCFLTFLSMLASSITVFCLVVLGCDGDTVATIDFHESCRERKVKLTIQDVLNDGVEEEDSDIHLGARNRGKFAHGEQRWTWRLMVKRNYRRLS